jgi:transporter family-2 protein
MFALLAGAAITVQAGSNSQLKESLGDPIAALFVNYVLGSALVLLIAVIARTPVPAADNISTTPWWAWTGGLLGILYGLSVVFLASRMGAATLISTVVTGQLILSVVVDHFGWIGFEVHRAGLFRMLGCASMVAGLVLIAKF